MTAIPCALVVAFRLAMAAGGGSAAAVFALADPGRPAEVVVNVAYATIRVEGTDSDAVEIDVMAPPDPSGARRALPMTGSGNRVEVSSPGNSRPVEILVRAPFRTDLRLESSNGGIIEVEAIEGALEVVNSNAAVILRGIGGSAVVRTSNAKISADFARIDATASISLFTSNDIVEVTLPADFAGRVLAESDSGPIESDFDVVPAASERDLVRRSGKVLSGSIGRGSASLRLRTENAGIRILLRH